MIVTPTASGKTLCYNLPVSTCCSRPERARHVSVPHQGAGRGPAATNSSAAVEAMGRTSAPSPTTATRRRTRAAPSASAPMSCYQSRHAALRASCRTTPNGRSCFENLRYIVIDELHYYRGVYGSHLANLLRRLKRICEFYGSKPQFICCSATIANPRELAEALTGRSRSNWSTATARRAGEKYFHLLQSAGREPAARHSAQLHARNAGAWR